MSYCSMVDITNTQSIGRSVYLTTVNNGTLIKTSLRSQDHHSYTVLVPMLIEPSQIVIDFYSRLLFFADVGVHAIMSVKYDGSDMKVVLGPQHVYMPESLAVFEDKVFYSETDVQTVYWANKFGHFAPQMLETLSSSTLTIFHPLLQPLQDPYENTCKLSKLSNRRFNKIMYMLQCFNLAKTAPAIKACVYL